MKANLLLTCLFVSSFAISNAQTTTSTTSTSTSTSTSHHAEAETSTSFAFSSTFKKDLYSKINTIVLGEFPKFDGKKEAVKSKDSEYKIELEKTAVKLEFKSNSTQSSALENKKKIKAIADKIKALQA